MTIDFRALCGELLHALENEGYSHWVITPDEDELCLRAHAALAKPEPESPTKRQLLMLADEIWGEDYEPIQVVRYARAVLARWGNS